MWRGVLAHREARELPLCCWTHRYCVAELVRPGPTRPACAPTSSLAVQLLELRHPAGFLSESIQLGPSVCAHELVNISVAPNNE